MKLLQWNIGNFDVRPRLPGRGPGGMSYSNGSPSREEDLAAVAAIIKAEAPDAVTLQEVLVRSDHHLRLAEATGYSIAAVGTAEPRHTQAVLVRPSSAEVLARLAPAPGINGVGARLKLLGGREVSVLSHHSAAGIHTAQRVAQHKALASWAGVSGPLVVGGDFNFDDAPGSMHHAAERLRKLLPIVPALATADWTAGCDGIAALRTALRDLGRDHGPTSGAPRLWSRILLPLGLPILPIAWALGAGRLRSRLDCVFASAPLESSETRVLRLTGPHAPRHPAVTPDAFAWMDHDPVLVRVEPP